jgi:hypothetical protein
VERFGRRRGRRGIGNSRGEQKQGREQ